MHFRRSFAVYIREPDILGDLGQPVNVKMSDIVYLFVELDGSARTGDKIVQSGLLCIIALNIDALSGHSAFAEAGNFIKDMIHRIGSSLFDTFQSCIGRSTHSLISQGFGSEGREYASDQTGDKVKQTFASVCLLYYNDDI